jgi:tetratricopeptide (TPR) repeat protein
VTRSPVRALVLAALVCPLAAGSLSAQQPPDPGKVIDVRAARPPAGNSFEALWGVYAKADQRGDQEARRAAHQEIRKYRVERNIRSLEPIALARLGEGLKRLEHGELDGADEDLRAAIALDPHLPDAYFALAQRDMKKGPLGILPAIGDTFSGLTARLPTILGRHRLIALLVPVLLFSLLVTLAVASLALVLRHGVLLRHDLEEFFGLDRSAFVTMVTFAVVLLLPAITFQGYGWLPFWWLAVLFLYFSITERVLVALALLGALAVGPVVRSLESRLMAAQNPLFVAGVQALEGSADTRSMRLLERSRERYTEDRDLAYLLAAHYRKAGRYEEAAGVYADLLRTQPSDPIALNNVANLSCASGEFPAAIPRKHQGNAANPTPAVAATLYYNMSLAYLQKFDPQPANEARSQALRLDPGLIQQYDAAWKYEIKNENAVVDLNLSAEELWGKFQRLREGVARQNVLGKGGGEPFVWTAGFNRFLGFLAVFVIVVIAMWRWRGPRAFTMRCVKCGTPFCRRCHLGAAWEGLCTQCHHLFVVRDGVSGPARNQKLMEVQHEDMKRERIFRALSLVFPGSGHVYAHRTLSGLAFIFVWSLVLSLGLRGGRVLPFTEAAGGVTTPWGLILGALVLLAVYIAANRARPDFEILMPAGRPPKRPRGGDR